MEKLCVSVPFLIPMCFATLSPNDLFTIQKIINFPSKLVNFSPIVAPVSNGKSSKSSFLFLNFLWNIAHHILIPTRKSISTSLKVGGNPFRSGGKGARAPSNINDSLAIIPFSPYSLKMEPAISFITRAGGVYGDKNTMVRC